MTRLFFSLQFRLVLGFALVLTLALAGVSFYVGYAAEKEVERFERSQENARIARVQQVIARFYTERREQTQLQTVLEQAGRQSGRRIILRGVNGEVVGDSHRRFSAQRVRPTPGTEPVVVMVATTSISRLNRSTPTSAATSGRRILSATFRPCLRSSTRNTMAVTPAPSSRSMT